MLEYGSKLIAEKRAKPTDDMLSIVVHARLDDEDPPQLTEGELYSFFSLLFSAGAETTRSAVSAGLLTLLEHPDQLAALREDRSLLPTATEEIVRWTSPSPSKRRTATIDTTLAGHHVKPGDKVLVWEGSANRDDSAFDGAEAVRHPPQSQPSSGLLAAAPISASGRISPGWKSACCLTKSSRVSAISSRPDRPSGTVPTATPACADSR